MKNCRDTYMYNVEESNYLPRPNPLLNLHIISPCQVKAESNNNIYYPFNTFSA